jgi:hypothetical protein
MIGTEEKMVVVLMNRGMIANIYDLGNATLESGEYSQLCDLAESNGYNIHLDSVVEDCNFEDLVNKIQADIGLT